MKIVKGHAISFLGGICATQVFKDTSRVTGT